MNPRKSTDRRKVLHSGRGDALLSFIGEEPLLIRIDDKPYVVVMRTPGEEMFQAAGFCLGEGVIDSADDIKTTGYDERQDPNLIDIWLQPERREKVKDVLGRRGFISQTSCGICGKEMIKDLTQDLKPAADGPRVDRDLIFGCLDKLDQKQKYYESTRCSHAALILDQETRPIAFAEDVGRHNALDKAIGKALMDRKLARASIVVLSSRNSYELVQKAARAGLPIMISNSRATAMAVDMGSALNMTLVFPDQSDILIACGPDRIKGIENP